MKSIPEVMNLARPAAGKALHDFRGNPEAQTNKLRTKAVRAPRTEVATPCSEVGPAIATPRNGRAMGMAIAGPPCNGVPKGHCSIAYAMNCNGPAIQPNGLNKR